jgi:hypothetical protein
MKGEPDVTVTIVLHREAAFALAALASLSDLVNVARGAGIAVETQAILDRPDAVTRHIVDARGRWIDTVEEVSFGDLALSRNTGTRLAHGRFLSFLDGDDLWGEHWLRAAFAIATTPSAPQDVVWHPEYLYVFREIEHGRPSETGFSFFSLLQSDDTPEFDPALLPFYSLWSANAFARREFHVRFPYDPVDRNRGLGIEDWSWNLATFGAGIGHRVVPGTVHLIRKKVTGSLQQLNEVDRLLPRLPPSFYWSRK